MGRGGRHSDRVLRKSLLVLVVLLGVALLAASGVEPASSGVEPATRSLQQGGRGAGGQGGRGAGGQAGAGGQGGRGAGAAGRGHGEHTHVRGYTGW